MNTTSGWQPISSAPVDGTHILAWEVGFGQRETFMQKYGKGSPGYAQWERGEGKLNCGWAWYEPKNNSIYSWNPTHWMTLSEPPKSGYAG